MEPTSCWPRPRTPPDAWGEDRNLRWTAFGPTNASLHRVNIAVTLGDAGTAIDVARTVDLGKIDVTERKASFLMDTARAFLQCGSHEGFGACEENGEN